MRNTSGIAAAIEFNRMYPAIRIRATENEAGDQENGGGNAKEERKRGEDGNWARPHQLILPRVRSVR
jgi:hypothetical protein